MFFYSYFPSTTYPTSLISIYVIHKSQLSSDHSLFKLFLMNNEAWFSISCFFCGGKTCKYENWTLRKNNAIHGLNSSWVTPNIIASQRPSSTLIRKYKIVNQFKRYRFWFHLISQRLGVAAIINLEEKGEHPNCGHGIHKESGYAYFPEEFMDSNSNDALRLFLLIIIQ